MLFFTIKIKSIFNKTVLKLIYSVVFQLHLFLMGKNRTKIIALFMAYLFK